MTLVTKAVRFDIWLIPVFFCLCGRLLAQNAGDSLPVHEKLYRLAQTLQDSGQFRESIDPLKKVIKEKPDHWEAYNLMAFAHYRAGKYRDALKALSKAEQIAPVNYQSVKLRGIIHYTNKSYAASKGALDTAAQLSIDENIEDPELSVYRARLMYAGKAYKDALASCEAALDIDPRYTDALLLKGEIRFDMKEYNYAIRELTEAISTMAPERLDYSAYKLRAKSYFETGNYKHAITDWNVYMEAFPQEEEALISRAAAKINVNDNSGAIADLDEAIRVNSKNPVSWCYRGVAKGGNKSFEEAMKDLNQSIKLKFDWPVAYVNRAAIKLALRDKRGACKDLEKADSLGSESAYKLIEQYCK